MREPLAYAGPGHFHTGGETNSHFTVRALEPYREAARPDEARAREWAAALDSVGPQVGPVRLQLTGVTLSSSAVMAQAEPVDDLARQLTRGVRAALGPHAWYENRGPQRNIWYSSVLHFAAPLVDAAGLVDWARQRRSVDPVEVVLDHLSLVRFATASRRPVESWR